MKIFYNFDTGEIAIIFTELDDIPRTFAKYDGLRGEILPPTKVMVYKPDAKMMIPPTKDPVEHAQGSFEMISWMFEHGFNHHIDVEVIGVDSNPVGRTRQLLDQYRSALQKYDN